MKSAELELHALECLLLAREVPDARQRQMLRELGLSWLHVAEQLKRRRHQEAQHAAAHTMLH
jgi:hypothetical protein